MGNPRSGSPWAPDLIAACQARGFDPQFEDAYYDWDFQSMQAFVATGRGITLLPQLGVNTVRPGVVAKRVEGAPIRHILSATPRSGLAPLASGVCTLSPTRSPGSPSPAPRRRSSGRERRS